MRARVDHVILGCDLLVRGIEAFSARAGVRPAIGGVHPGLGTGNALVASGDREYVEILGREPKAGPLPNPHPYGFAPGVELLEPIGWAVATTSLEEAVRRIESAGIRTHPAVPGARERPDGGHLSWEVVRLQGAELGFPFLICWDAGVEHPAESAPTGCGDLALSVASPAAESLSRVTELLDLQVEVESAARTALAVGLTSPKGRLSFSSLRD